MTLHPKLVAAITDAEEQLHNDQKGHLSWSSRVRLWIAMNEVFGESALTRRGRLALDVANGLGPEWRAGQERISGGEASRFFTLPQAFLDLGTAYIEHNIELRLAMASFDELWMSVEDAMEDRDYLGAVPFMCGLACLEAFRSFRAEYLWGDPCYHGSLWNDIVSGEVTEESYSVEPDRYECHYYAAMISARAWLDESHGFEARRSFWERWLHGPFVAFNQE